MTINENFTQPDLNEKLLTLEIYDNYLSSLKKFNELSVGIYFMTDDGVILDKEIARISKHIRNIRKCIKNPGCHSLENDLRNQ